LSWKRTLFFLLILVGVAGLYYFKIRKENPANQTFSLSTESARTYLLTVNQKDSVNHLKIRDSSKKTEIFFQKIKEHDWRITKPIDYPAEPILIDGLVSLLKLSPRLRPFPFEGLSGKEFGFDSPRLSVCVATEQLPIERCLIIGSDAVAFKGAYAKWADESFFFLVDANFLSAFDKTLYALRKKKIFILLEKEVSSIQFQSQKKEFEMKHKGKQWLLEKPVQAIAGPDAIDNLLVYLNGLYVKEFLDDERPDNQKLGFKSPARTVRVKFQDGSEQMLIQGREAPGRDAYYAKGSDGKTVLLVASGKLNKMEDVFKALTS